MFENHNVSSLQSEYANFEGRTDDEILRALVLEHDWTIEGASEILALAKSKGTFLLRNALALSIALGVEDGEDGF